MKKFKRVIKNFYFRKDPFYLRLFAYNLRVFALCFLIPLFGCVSLGEYNPATGRNEIVLISTDSETAIGKDIHAQILKKYSLSQNIPEEERLRRIGQRIASVSDRQDYTYQFFLLEDETLNAFTTPGGNIYFNSGLMEKLKKDDLVAAVIAHEVGHCAAKHVAKKYQASLGYNLIGSIILGQLAPGTQEIASLSSNVVMSLVSSAYSRKDEYQADALAVKYMELAGYDLQAMVDVLETLKKESKGTEGILLLRSHPYLKDRIENVKKEIALKEI